MKKNLIIEKPKEGKVGGEKNLELLFKKEALGRSNG
jgi:hypothetical protein